VAGFIEMPAPLFAFLSLVGTTVWVTAIALMGYGVGSAWHSVAHGIAVAGYAIAVVVVAAIAVFVVYRLREVRREQAAGAGQHTGPGPETAEPRQPSPRSPMP
jgi:membrane protein DedA with SNARE-associated domain